MSRVQGCKSYKNPAFLSRQINNKRGNNFHLFVCLPCLKYTHTQKSAIHSMTISGIDKKCKCFPKVSSTTEYHSASQLNFNKVQQLFLMNIHLTQFAKTKQTQRKNKSPDTGEPLIPTSHNKKLWRCAFVFICLHFQTAACDKAAVAPPSCARTRPSFGVLTRPSLFFFLSCAPSKAPPLLVSVPISGASWT